MTQEEKELLLIDLCARLPYGVRYKGDGGWGINPYQHTTAVCAILNSEEPLLYLRPMSSMTEKEKEEYDKTFDWDYSIQGTPFDWLNKKMFDYRGLIPMRLALEASEKMYKTD